MPPTNSGLVTPASQQRPLSLLAFSWLIPLVLLTPPFGEARLKAPTQLLVEV